MCAVACTLLAPPLVPASAQAYQNYLEVRGERLANQSTLVQNFRAMAYGGQVARWRTGVRVFLVGDTAPEHRERVRAFLGELATLTNLAFSLVDEESRTNLRIYFSARDWFNSQAARAFARPQTVLCFTNMRAQAGAIQQAFVVIPEDLQPRASRACLAHEMMHAIGFGGHPPQEFDSALRNGIAADRLTTNDRILIRARYDERLWAAANAGDAVGVATTVIGELLGRVQDAADVFEALAYEGGEPISKYFGGLF
ncbi:MAG: DUF2927 domain-containing protein [Alphaproteobacteria bacterium]|nr:DUF2927 domain-containing protein [Alphaproteobacteria bacterium]